MKNEVSLAAMDTKNNIKLKILKMSSFIAFHVIKSDLRVPSTQPHIKNFSVFISNISWLLVDGLNYELLPLKK